MKGISPLKTIEIDGYAGGLTFSYAHFLPGHPQCGRIHGHDGAISVRLTGRGQYPFGFVADFSKIKEIVRKQIKRTDHFLLVPAGLIGFDRKKVPEFGDEYLRIVEEDLGMDSVRIVKTSEVCVIPGETTAESLAEITLLNLLDEIGDRSTFESIEVGWFEGRGTSAWSKWTREGIE